MLNFGFGCPSLSNKITVLLLLLLLLVLVPYSSSIRIVIIIIMVVIVTIMVRDFQLEYVNKYCEGMMNRIHII